MGGFEKKEEKKVASIKKICNFAVPNQRVSFLEINKHIYENETHFPTFEQKTQKQAWFQRKNVHCQRPQGVSPQKSQGQKETDCF
jgi:hypothetical protein